LSSTPNTYRHHPAKVAVITIVSIIVIAVLVVGIWFGYWWLALRVRSHQNVVNRASYEFQNTYATLVLADIVDVKGLDVQLTADPGNAAIAAQKKALVIKTCNDAVNVNDKATFFAGSPSTLAWLQSNCG
jgi:hypothetical protein